MLEERDRREREIRGNFFFLISNFSSIDHFFFRTYDLDLESRKEGETKILARMPARRLLFDRFENTVGL